MDEVLLWSFLAKAIYAAGAVLLLIGLLRLWNALSPSKFDDVFERILEDKMAGAVYYGLRFLGLAVLVGLLMSCAASPAASAVFPKTYDRAIEQAAEKWLPGWPWKLLKAQYIAESGLKPDARSPVGAEGISQMMPATWEEVMREMGRGRLDRRLAEPSIEAGAFYLAKLRRSWSSPRPATDRIKLSQASYNAGLGSLLSAQRLCNMAALYEAIVACLPEVTGRHAQETLTYVPRIWRYWQMLSVT